MKRKQIGKLLMGISIGGFFVMSASFCLMAVSALRILPGLLCWGGLLIGGVFQLLTGHWRRQYCRTHPPEERKIQHRRCGLLTFAASLPGKVADFGLLTCLIAGILIFCITGGFGFICNLSMSATVFAFCMHCVLNGRSYFVITYRDAHQKGSGGDPCPLGEERKRRGRFQRSNPSPKATTAKTSDKGK